MNQETHPALALPYRTPPSSSASSVSGVGSCQARFAYPELIAGGGGVLPSNLAPPGVSGDSEVRDRVPEPVMGLVGEGIVVEGEVVIDPEGI